MRFHSKAFQSQARLREAVAEIRQRAERITEIRGRTEELVTTILVQTSGFELDQILCVIAHTAAELVGARNAGLGVYRHDYQLIASRYHDVRYEGAREIGRVTIHPIPDLHPRPGSIRRQPESVPVTTSAVRHPARADGTVLEVAIRVHDQVFGSLCLADKADGRPFGGDDEMLILTLATAAGIAIDNARKVEQHRLRQAWTEAARAIGAELRAGIDTTTALRLIADTATSLTAVGHCLLVVPGESGTATPEVAELVIVDSAGSRRSGAEEVLAVVDATVRAVFRAGSPLRSAAPEIDHTAGSGAPIGPVMMLPLPGTDSPAAVLISIRPVGAPAFPDEQFEAMSVFTDQVAEGLRSAGARRQLELDERAERDRVARVISQPPREIDDVGAATR
ncbi:GAF domain-containing protein [Nocardia sp. alder85J]|uniref:GAF domain-containing protein n=1 Tax=Nocardia sp. alder85J TaxID=2862949 RepID=UPI001CD7BF52|nr:GAF domain-containing protein [Nocardia sp. alder85J]MCX4093896.1 GAF domain-containing protein [Nocardia sp. alder85J]